MLKPNPHLCLIADPGSVHIRRWIRFFGNAGYNISIVSYRRVQDRPASNVKLYDLTRIFDRRGRAWSRKLRYPVWAGVVKQLVRQISPDIIHAHNVAGAGWLGLFSGFHPLVVTAHGSDMMLMKQRSWVYRKLNSMVLGHADHITAGSWALYDQCVAYGADSKKTQCLLLGTDMSLFSSKLTRNQARRSLGLGPGPVIFFIRSMHEIYNPGILAGAMARLVDKVHGARFVFPAGNSDPVVLARHRGRVHALGLADSVIYLDPIEDDAKMAVWYAAADICVSIPSSDGVSIAVWEAMASGRAVVMTDLPAYRGLFQHMRHVVKIAVANEHGLVDALIYLLENPDEKEYIGHNARAVVRRHAEHAKTMKQVEKIYKNLMSAHGDE